MTTREYYAGMFLLVPKAWEAERAYCVRGIETTPGYYGPDYRAQFPDALDKALTSLRTQLELIHAGRTLAEAGQFAASFDDPTYGLSWAAHAKFHG